LKKKIYRTVIKSP